MMDDGKSIGKRIGGTFEDPNWCCFTPRWSFADEKARGPRLFAIGFANLLCFVYWSCSVHSFCNP